MDNEKMLENIRSLCKMNNITTTRLEEILGFSQGLISRWKDKTPSLDRVVDIADYFHISLDEVVGRNGNNINDNFIKALYDKTINKEITWKTFDTSVDESGIKQYSEDFSYFSPMDENDYKEFRDTHKEKSYYFEYMHGYISIHAMYEYHNVTAPRELKLFIQPDIQAELIEQSFEYSELLSLWLKVLISLEDDAPDEIRAEDLKNSFIQNADKKSTSDIKTNEMENLLHSLDDSTILQLMETMNTPEMLKIREIFSNTNFQAAVQSINRLQKYYDKINSSRNNNK